MCCARNIFIASRLFLSGIEDIRLSDAIVSEAVIKILNEIAPITSYNFFKPEKLPKRFIGSVERSSNTYCY